MVQRANAGMPIGQLAGIGLGIVDELSQCASRHGGMNGERESRNHHIGNRLELLERIVERTALEDRLGDVSAGTTEQNRIAVRTGASDRGGTERTASSALVFNDDGAKHRL